MINFRFHLVSLVAVFLALGLGILVGSTVVDQKIVDGLDSQIRSVRSENSTRKAQSKVLSQQNTALQNFIKLTEPFIGDARLDGQSVAVVAEHGVDRNVVKQTEQALQAAGADVPAVLWLDDSWQLDTSAQVTALQTALDLHGTASTMRDAALRLFAQRLARSPTAKRKVVPGPTTTSTGPGPATTSTGPRRPNATTVPTSVTSKPTVSSTSTTSIPARPPIDALTALDQAGFLSITDGNASAFDSFPTHVVDVLVITGDDSDFAGSDLTSAFVRSLVQISLPTVVAAVYDPGNNAAVAPKRGASLASVLDDNVLSHAVSTVDDLEQVQGRVAVVLSLAIVGIRNIGHYGYGTGASAPLPPHGS